MADYKLTATPDLVVRTADETWVPNNPENADWQAYQVWLEKGGVPDPYEPPPEPPPPELTPEQGVLYDHENRIRGLEGVPPLALDDFKNIFRGGEPPKGG